MLKKMYKIIKDIQQKNKNEKNYFLIPVTDDQIFINDINLYNILKNIYPILADMESERIKILYSTSPLVSMPPSEMLRYDNHNNKTNQMYKTMKIPKYLVAIGNEYKVREILTNIEIIPKYPAALLIRKVYIEKVLKYLEQSNYTVCVSNYFESFKNLFKENQEKSSKILFLKNMQIK